MSHPVGRRQFLKVSTGALAVGLAACSSDGDSAPGETGSSTPGTTDAAPTTVAPTTAPTTTTAPPTTAPEPAAADGVLVAPGSPGLIDEATYQQRASEYLRFSTETPNVTSPVGVAAQLARATRESDYSWPIGDVTVQSLAPVTRQR